MQLNSLLKRLLVFYLLIFSALIYASEPIDTPRYSNLYAYVYMGNNIGETHSEQLESVNFKGSGPLEWGIGIGHNLSHSISIEGVFEYWGERYERKDGVLIAGTANNIIQVGGLGLSSSILYNYTKNPFHAYIGAGAGYFLTGVLVTSPLNGLLTIEGAPSDKLLPEYHTVFGADYKINEEFSLGLELKHRVLYADFGAYTHGKVDVGGTYLLLVARFW